jgi:hypothetical protein
LVDSLTPTYSSTIFAGTRILQHGLAIIQDYQSWIILIRLASNWHYYDPPPGHAIISLRSFVISKLHKLQAVIITLRSHLLRQSNELNNKMMLRNVCLVLLSTVTAQAAFEEWVDILMNDTAPIPTCLEAGVLGIEHCVLICEAIGQKVALKKFHDVNSEIICYCETNDACNDRPTCAQLQILPGKAEQGCTDYCEPGDFVAVEDGIQLAGGMSNANKNQTHLIVECRCDGVKECSDFILFSDLSFLNTCKELGITTDETCVAHCEENSFDQGDEFSDVNGLIGCGCYKDSDVAEACQDVAETTQDNGGTGTDDDTGDDGTSGALGRAAGIWMIASTVSLLGFLWN